MGAHIRHSPSAASTGWTVKFAAVLALGLLLLLLVAELAFIQARDRGLLHITVEDGLVNFDLLSIAEGANGDLWIGHRTSFSQYWGTVNDDFIRQNYLDAAHVDHVAVTVAGEVWAVNNDPFMLKQFDGVGWKDLPIAAGLKNELFAIAAAPNAGVWLIARQQLGHFDGKNWRVHPFPAGLVVDGSAAAASTEGSVWFAGQDISGGSPAPGLLHFDGQNWQFFGQDAAVNSRVETINVDDEGTVWAGTRQALFRYDGRDWTLFSTENGLLGNRVLSIAFAPEGTVWVGTDKGISAYDGQSWLSLIPAAPNCWATDLVVNEDDDIYYLQKNCIRYFGLDRVREDGMRKAGSGRVLLPADLIGTWHNLRIALLAIVTLLLAYVGQQRSQIPIRSRLLASAGVSAVTCAIFIIAGAIYVGFSFSPCHAYGFWLLVPAWLIASLLSSVISFIVGYIQPDNTTLTTLAAVFVGGIIAGFLAYPVLVFTCPELQWAFR